MERELLKAVVDICEKEHLRYYIIGGTLLGAVRHKGYIPWDDDTDIAMPREDYDSFLQVAERYLCAYDGYGLETYRGTDEYLLCISRITDCHVKFRVSYSTTGRQENIWVDIFPLDGMPNGKIASKIHVFHLLYHRALFVYSTFSKYAHQDREKRRWYEKPLLWIGYHFPLEKLLSSRKCLESLDKAMRRYPCEASPQWINFMSVYKWKDVFPKEVFGNGALYEFEGMQLRGPQDYETYLTKLYGDYMTPPPISERGGHCAEIVETEPGYLDKICAGKE